MGLTLLHTEGAALYSWESEIARGGQSVGGGDRAGLVKCGQLKLPPKHFVMARQVCLHFGAVSHNVKSPFLDTS